MRKKIWGNTVVKNEGKYLWFAIKSVINYLDKVIIYDTGSIDDTLKIIDQLKKEYSSKIIFKQIGEVDANGLTKARQEMLNETKADWLLLVDGDEVWWDDSIKKTISVIQSDGDRLYALINPILNLVGDIYHFHGQESGKYKILGKVGHFNIRAVNRKIKGLYIKNEFPMEGFYTREDKLLQNYGQDKLKFVDGPILHFSHLERSNFAGGDEKSLNRVTKFKYEIGNKFPKEFKYPEVFYQSYPAFISSPWRKMTAGYKLRAFIETPLRKIKRRIKK